MFASKNLKMVKFQQDILVGLPGCWCLNMFRHASIKSCLVIWMGTKKVRNWCSDVFSVLHKKSLPNSPWSFENPDETVVTGGGYQLRFEEQFLGASLQ